MALYGHLLVAIDETDKLRLNFGRVNRATIDGPALWTVCVSSRAAAGDRHQLTRQLTRQLTPSIKLSSRSVSSLLANR